VNVSIRRSSHVRVACHSGRRTAHAAARWLRGCGTHNQLSYVTGAPGPWNFSLPSATTDPWHTNTYYGSLFTGDDITGRAADGTIVSFGISGGQVTTILMGFEEGFTY